MDRLTKNLRQVKNILLYHGLKTVLAGGAVLGYYRDGDFIPWDRDVDLFLTYEDFSPLASEIKIQLMAKGFKVKSIEGYGQLKIIAKKHNMKYELTSYLTDGVWNYRKHEGFCTAFIPKEFNSRIKEITLRGVEYYIPEDTEGYLDYMYKNWKVPCKGKLKDYSSADYIRRQNENS